MKFFSLLFCAAFLLFRLNSFAQETGGVLTGRILDTEGNPLAGATVTAVHEPSGTRYETQTSADGRYHLPGLRVGGPYTLTVTNAGMNPETLPIAQLHLGETLTQNVTLKASVQELSGVVVKAEHPGLKPNAYGAGLNLGRDQLRTVPTATRSITDMTRLIPQGSKDNSFAGTNFRYNNVTIDGAINNDAIGFSPSLGGQTGTSNMPGSSTRNNPISLDAIEDIQVYLSPYDVTLGNFSGASINAVTRSGTNTVTGSVYAYGRNGAVTGPDNTGEEQQRKMPSDFHDYQVGARVGFPIVKNKLFFFSNEELTRRVDPIQQVAGSAASGGILSLADADSIRSHMLRLYNFDPGTAGLYDVYSNSNKFFNRLDWNLGRKTQFVLRNNTMQSQAINMERDQTDFRFAGIGYEQVNNQTSTVAELRTRFNNRWSNSAVVGFTAIHDYRNPLSDPAMPQVQIVGRSPGSTIFLGTDREASIFNQRQRTLEITDNVTWNLGKHTLTMGTHDELYHITYGFVNAWNGRVTYNSITDFLAGNPDRVQGSYNYTDNQRSYILAHPGAVFNADLYSGYIQDEVQVSDRFKVIYGLRADYDIVPEKQPLSQKTREAMSDPNFGFTYTYTQMNQINQTYLTRPEISPRIGFRADPRGDQSVILRGGLGIFTSRIPFAWLGYAFYNNGNTYGSFDQKTYSVPPQPFVAGTDPLSQNQGNGHPGIAGFIANQGQIVNNPNAGQTQVDLVDNHFIMPEVLRGSFAVDYTDPYGFKYTLEALFTKTLKDILFQQVNIQDNPTYYAYDTAVGKRKQPIFGSSINPQFANAYELSNTNQGYRYSITAQVSRKFPFGLQAMAAYTYGRSMDMSNGIRNSMESNWQLNQALNPNSPQLAPSNFDLRHRIVADLGYEIPWHRNWKSSFVLFFSGQSGQPYTYGFVNYSVQNTPQQISLAYIPLRGETVNFFTGVDGKTATQQAAAFDAFIDANKYLRSRRGDFTQRNAVTTPWNNDLDFHFSQDFGLSTTHPGQIITFTFDILNLTNLLNPGWGRVYFVPDTYNGTASVGLVPYIPGQSSGGYPLYQFVNPGKPYSVDFMGSRWQMKFGVRYSF